jgi:uroporphyrinogen-III synthase
LWAVVSHQVGSTAAGPTQAVLLVRGTDAGAPAHEGQHGHGRDWLAQRLVDAGVRVDYAVAYQRVAPVWSAEQLALAQQSAADGSVWLFSSSQAAAHLQSLMPQQNWARARALATHPRIGAALVATGWGDVSVCKGDLSSVLAALGGATDINRIQA